MCLSASAHCDEIVPFYDLDLGVSFLVTLLVLLPSVLTGYPTIVRGTMCGHQRAGLQDDAWEGLFFP